nr:MAG TPA: hypothetical protein [Caudoviricetes sp.]
MHELVTFLYSYIEIVYNSFQIMKIAYTLIFSYVCYLF